jgi:Na+/H+ antiporter NhaC
MLDLTSSWALAYSLKEVIPGNFLTLVIGLFVTGLYYLAATLVFPDDASNWADLDDYYFEHKRQVLGGILASRVLARAAQFALGAAGWNYFPAFAAFVVLTLAAMLVKGRRANIAILILFLSLYPAFAALGLVLRL